MTAIERTIRDERGTLLDKVEAALFGAVIGLTEDNPARTREFNLRMKNFVRLSDHMRLVFGDEWPNRSVPKQF